MSKVSETNRLDEVCTKLITTGTVARQTLEGIMRISPGELAAIPNLSGIIRKVYTPQEQFELFGAILLKCNSHSLASNKAVLTLKADTMYHQASLIIRFNADETRAGVREISLSKALNLLDESNYIVQTQKLALKIDASKAACDLVKAFGKDEIEGSHVKSFELAESSLQFRTKALPSNHTSILASLLNTAEIGQSIKNAKINIEAIKYAKLAYNMAMIVENPYAAASALKIQAEIFQSFGDNELSVLLHTQAKGLLPVELSESKESKSSSSEISTTAKSKLNQMVVHGSIDENTMAIKATIQKSVLDPIKAAAAKGKWIEVTIAGNIGISGYLGEFIETKLGDLNSEKNVKIALELCFEAISLGIMSSSKPNPLCAAIFAQKYPLTIASILEDHPEYFVDSFILRTSVLDASEHSSKLLGYELVENGAYNSYFELEIMPFVVARLNDIVFSPIAGIITNGSWNITIQNCLLALASEEYLTTSTSLGLGGSYLGLNLGKFSDMINIVQVLAFKTLVATIIEEESTNYSPISVFTLEYPKIVDRVISDHPEFLQGNKTITGICNQVLSTIGDEVSESKEQESEISIDEVSATPTDIVIITPQTPTSSAEIEIVGDGDTAIGAD